jgi:transposase
MSAARTDSTVSAKALYVALELGLKEWKLAMSVGLGQKPAFKTVEGGDTLDLLKQIARAKTRFGLPADAPVQSCYEAGRDGFWLHRFLASRGIENAVVDSSSIEVNRRRRRAKSDRLDAAKLLLMLMRYAGGESRVWSVVNVPSLADEDQRQLHRELKTLTDERTRLTNRIHSLLACQGVQLQEIKNTFLQDLQQVRLWNGDPLPPGLHRRLQHEFAHLQLVDKQLEVLEKERLQEIRTSSSEGVKKARQLMELRGIGAGSSWMAAMEVFSWRKIKNRRQLGSLVGLTPTPYASGASEHEQGISKAGNRWLRSVAIELAWSWVKFQPSSRLTLWYYKRFALGSKRQRKIGIVALARKLLIALWRYLQTGEVPDGAVLSDWKRKGYSRYGRLSQEPKAKVAASPA